jgi:hypothetical protein
MVARLQPPTVTVIERLFGAKLQHDHSSGSDLCPFREWLCDQTGRLISRQIPDASFHLVNDRRPMDKKSTTIQRPRLILPESRTTAAHGSR